MTDLIDLLRAENRVWVRAAALRPDREWLLAAVEVTTGVPPPSWRRRRWLYQRAALIATTAAGTTVAWWLERGRVLLRPLSAAIAPSVQPSVDRRDSRFSLSLFEPLEWPCHDWNVGLAGSGGSVYWGEFVSARAPAFIDFEDACGNLFGLPTNRNRTFTGHEFIVRQQDLRGRIESVHIKALEVTATVGGNDLDGMLLTLGGEHGTSHVLTANDSKVHYSLAAPLPPKAWLALHRDQELIDRRILDPAWGRHADVQVEIDALTRAELLISRGEDVNTEFKQQLPEHSDSVENVMKTIAAFANGGGGVLLFGVANDRAVVGLGDASQGQIDRFTSLVRDWVRPPVPFRPELVEVDGRAILIVEIGSGQNPPYGVGTSDRSLTYYVRTAGTTSPATPDEVRAAVQARIPSSSHGFPLHYR